MTTISVSIGGTDVSSKIKRIEIWRRATQGIGSIQIRLENTGGIYNGVFQGDALIIINLDGHLFFKGYLDHIRPEARENSELKMGEEMFLTGRDVGQDLLNRFVDKLYWPQKADDIIADLITTSGTEVTFKSPSEAPQIFFDSRGAFLLSSFCDILELIDYDGFVDVNKEWNMFPIGSRDSGITLKMVAEASDNNIIEFLEHTEKDTTDLKNYIVIFGDHVKDSWTEANADGWSVWVSGNIISDHMGQGITPAPIAGIASIKAEKGTGTIAGCELTFPRYNHDFLDFSKIPSDVLSFQIYQKKAQGALGTAAYVEIRLRDTSGNVISFNPGSPQKYDQWAQISAPIGYEVMIGQYFSNWRIWYQKSAPASRGSLTA